MMKGPSSRGDFNPRHAFVVPSPERTVSFAEAPCDEFRKRRSFRRGFQQGDSPLIAVPRSQPRSQHDDLHRRRSDDGGYEEYNRRRQDDPRRDDEIRRHRAATEARKGYLGDDMYDERDNPRRRSEYADRYARDMDDEIRRGKVHRDDDYERRGSARQEGYPRMPDNRDRDDHERRASDRYDGRAGYPRMPDDKRHGHDKVHRDDDYERRASARKEYDERERYPRRPDDRDRDDHERRASARYDGRERYPRRPDDRDRNDHERRVSARHDGREGYPRMPDDGRRGHDKVHRDDDYERRSSARYDGRERYPRMPDDKRHGHDQVRRDEDPSRRKTERYDPRDDPRSEKYDGREVDLRRVSDQGYSRRTFEKDGRDEQRSERYDGKEARSKMISDEQRSERYDGREARSKMVSDEDGRDERKKERMDYSDARDKALREDRRRREPERNDGREAPSRKGFEGHGSGISTKSGSSISTKLTEGHGSGFSKKFTEGHGSGFSRKFTEGHGSGFSRMRSDGNGSDERRYADDERDKVCQDRSSDVSSRRGGHQDGDGIVIKVSDKDCDEGFKGVTLGSSDVNLGIDDDDDVQSQRDRELDQVLRYPPPGTPPPGTFKVFPFSNKDKEEYSKDAKKIKNCLESDCDDDLTCETVCTGTRDRIVQEQSNASTLWKDDCSSFGASSSDEGGTRRQETRVRAKTSFAAHPAARAMRNATEEIPGEDKRERAKTTLNEQNYNDEVEGRTERRETEDISRRISAVGSKWKATGRTIANKVPSDCEGAAEIVADGSGKPNSWCAPWEESVRKSSSFQEVVDSRHRPKACFHEVYEVIHGLGAGGFSCVYAARRTCPSKTTPVDVAVKITRLVQTVSAAKVEWDKNRCLAVEREEKLLRYVSGVNTCVQFYDILYDSVYAYMIMERAPMSLLHFIDSEMRYDEMRIRFILIKMLEAIKAIHAINVMHRDIKPDNFVAASADCVKLCDFGLAHVLNKESYCCDMCGTAPFMSPEVVRGKPYGLDADMWSFGVTVYLFFFGELPFKSKERNNEAMKAVILEGRTPAFRPTENDLYDGCWLTPGATCFAQKLLMPDRRVRMTADQALANRWTNFPISDAHRNTLPSLRPILERGKKQGVFAAGEPQARRGISDPLIRQKQAFYADRRNCVAMDRQTTGSTDVPTWSIKSSRS